MNRQQETCSQNLEHSLYTNTTVGDKLEIKVCIAYSLASCLFRGSFIVYTEQHVIKGIYGFNNNDNDRAKAARVDQK